MKHSDVIRTVVTVTKSNEERLMELCNKYPVPSNKDELKELNELIYELKCLQSDIKYGRNTPTGKGYSGMHKVYSCCIGLLENKLK